MTGTTLSANAGTGNQISQRLEQLQQRIEKACQHAGRNSRDVSLLPVSKTCNVQTLKCAWELGLRQFGENYLQEALAKMTQLPDDIGWHFIGPLQSNKTQAAAQHFDWVHSVDREKIARRLSAQRPATAQALNICLQVNISGEASKAGVAPDHLAALYSAVRDLPGLSVKGLMCLPLASSDPKIQQQSFRAMRELRDNVMPDAPVLSMGMSADLEAAIAEGSTLIRIGTALFGPRAQNHT